jgi:hypothetical protein
MNNPTPTVRTPLSGSFHAKQGNAVYAYSGTYGVNSEGTWWTVSVRCGDLVRGTLMGSLEQVKSPTPRQIAALIESRIEALEQ